MENKQITKENKELIKMLLGKNNFWVSCKKKDFNKSVKILEGEDND